MRQGFRSIQNSNILQKFFSSPRAKLTAVVMLIALFSFLLGVNIKRFIPVAFVNGTSISGNDFSIRLLEQSGNIVLQDLIVKELIDQEAGKRKIKITKKEVDDRMKQIDTQLKKVGSSLKNYYLVNSTSEHILKEEVYYQLLIDKMFGGAQAKATSSDIEQFYKQNNIRKGVGAILISQQITITDVVERNKLRDNFQNWLQNAMKKAKIRRLI